MKYIKLKDLKKEAKNQRKSNNEIKNHSESLNLIAKKYNKEKWEDLVDSSVLLLKNEDESINIFEKIIESGIIEIEDINDIFESNDINALSDYIIRKCYSDRNDFTIFDDKCEALVNFYFYLLKDFSNDPIIKMKKFNELLDLNNLTHFMLDYYNGKNLKNESLLKKFYINVLSVNIAETKILTNIDHAMQDQFSFTVTELTTTIPLFITMLEKFYDKNEEELYFLLSKKENISSFFFKEFLVEKKLLQEYQESLLGKRTTLYNRRFLKKHFSLLDNYIN